MRTTRVIALLGTVLAISTTAATASAKSTALVLDQGTAHTALAPGAYFQATQEEHGSRHVVFSTGGGTIECRNENDHNGFSGTVTSNEKGSDSVSLTSGGFEYGEACTEVTGAPAFVEPIDFPWNLSVKKTGAVSVSGTPKVAFTVTFSTGPVCTYEKASLKGAAVPTPETGVEQPLALSFANEVFKLNRSTAKGNCPKTDALSMELETSGEAGPIYDVID